MANSPNPQAFSPLPGTMPMTKHTDFSKPPTTSRSARKGMGAIALAFLLVMVIVIIISLLRNGNEDQTRNNNNGATPTVTPSGTPIGTPTPTEEFKADCLNTCSDGEFLDYAAAAISKLKSYKAEGSELVEDFTADTEVFFEKGFFYKELNGNFGSSATRDRTFTDTDFHYIISQSFENSTLKDTHYERKANEIDVDIFFKTTMEFLNNAYGTSGKPQNVKEVRDSEVEKADGISLRKFVIITSESDNTSEETESQFWFNEQGLLVREKDDAGVLNGIYDTKYFDFDKVFNVEQTYKSVKQEVIDNI